ncbi:unnamed protein product [Ambrosiozyma monospora]|uniref:Unnamed protein product n=1 Tax=Ambrosiozyma monospora TaxID=43982 RepID=A0A9W7DER2_AMBMO|nr:unnamed protein product [Ambrosiozyma monospora]
MKDCMWSFTESVLDYLELPNSNMSPKLRIDMYKRMMIVHNLTRFSNLLFRIDTWLEDAGGQFHFVSDGLIDAVRIGLQLRRRVLAHSQTSNWDGALKLSFQMVSMLQEQIMLLGIGNDIVATVDFESFSQAEEEQTNNNSDHMQI